MCSSTHILGHTGSDHCKLHRCSRRYCLAVGITPVAISIADGNNNGKSDLTVKVFRAPLGDILYAGQEILVTVRGTANNGTRWWSGQDIIKVVEPK